MYFITIKRMLEVCFSAHPNIQYRALFLSISLFALEQIDKNRKLKLYKMENIFFL